MDDDVSSFSACRWLAGPCLRRAWYVTTKAISHQFEWVIQTGSNARRYRDLDVHEHVLKNYIRIPYPERSISPAIHNKS